MPNAIRYFLNQDYGHKELIIIDDGSDAIRDLVPEHPFIKYFRLERKITLGAKLNLACSYAKGKIVAHWDDDDWYAERRLTYQVASLNNNGTDVCGINKLLYYDLRNKNAYQYIYPANQRTWLLGSSLCYTLELWKSNRFADIDVGMDGLFVRNTAPHRVTVLSDHSFAVHMIHNYNVSPKKTSGAWWHAHAAADIEALMGADWKLYHTNGNGCLPKPNLQKVQPGPARPHKTPGSFKNIYACLVHENEDCITDLVQNLHYNDPSSIIIIYDGGINPNLVPKDFPFDKFGAVVHPHPRPMQHGYLHNFALDCMDFALDHFLFDAITIVDSDQLSIRRGYSDYLAGFFSKVENLGMLSSNPERVTSDNRTNFVARQAHKEYELWKPFLSTFPGGEDKFAHWTFWPSTVFTADAVRDLVKIFKDNKQLQHIMQQTKIWATEEVILPTLVKLLGYEIAANPCNYDFVRYRKPIGHEDVRQAQKNNEAYWIHPIERKFDNPVRKLIRDQSAKYSVQSKAGDKVHPVKLFAALPLVNRIRKIGGWLSDREAELLIDTTVQTCEFLQADLNIVEVGSYHGKSTIIFGTIIKHLFPLAKVFAIDLHDGRLGAEDQGLRSFPPSYEIFQKNLSDAGVADRVEVIKDRSYNIPWKLPISLLFIDGLHDYRNVSKDFKHFSEWLKTGGVAAFHDCSDYFPGVKLLVDELLASGTYRKMQLVESLMIVQKI